MLTIAVAFPIVAIRPLGLPFPVPRGDKVFGRMMRTMFAIAVAILAVTLPEFQRLFVDAAAFGFLRVRK